MSTIFSGFFNFSKVSPYGLFYAQIGPGMTNHPANSRNELVNSAEQGDLSYDDNGNLQYRFNAAFLSYDDENRLISIEQRANGFDEGGDLQDGDLLTIFHYDGLGRLRLRTEFVLEGAPDGEWVQQSQTVYIYDGNQHQWPRPSAQRGHEAGRIRQ